MVKKKKLRLWFGSLNGPITCKLEMDFFFHNSEISAVRHVYVTQSSLKRPIHVTRGMAVAQEFRCGLSKFHCRKDTRYKQTNCRPQYIPERIGIWCRF